jgi:glutaredoxin-related protein
MKKQLTNMVNRGILSLVMLFTSIVAFAQEGTNVVTKSTRTTTKTTTDWYTMPWVWVVGGAVFILLLIAILRGGERRTDA